MTTEATTAEQPNAPAEQFGMSLGDALDANLEAKWTAQHDARQETPAKPVVAEEPKPAPESEVNPPQKWEDTGEQPEPKEDDAEQPKQPQDGGEDQDPGEGEDDPILPSLDDEEEEDPEPEPVKPDESKPSSKKEEEEEPKGKDPYENPNVKKRLDRARKKWEQEAEEREAKLKEEYEAKIRELSEREPEDKGKAELSAAEKEELMMLRRRISAENDPEIKEKFDAQIADNLDTVKETIMGVRWNAEDRERLEKIGDFEEFARSNPRGFKVILDAVEEVNPVEADIIRSKIADNASLRRGKQRTIKELSEKANEWFEKQNEESQKRAKETEEQLEARRAAYREAVRVRSENKRFKPVPVEGLEGEKRKSVEEINAVKAKQRKVFDVYLHKAFEALSKGDPNPVLDIASGAALAIEFKAKYESSQAKIKELQSKLEARSKAATVSKGDRASVAAQSGEGKKAPKTWEEGMDAGAAKLGWA